SGSTTGVRPLLSPDAGGVRLPREEAVWLIRWDERRLAPGGPSQASSGDKQPASFTAQGRGSGLPLPFASESPACSLSSCSRPDECPSPPTVSSGLSSVAPATRPCS